ncbi:MAG: RpiB/LacA/LacB family sugar-phosphate isomerase [Erysipelotrichaceae bacterium]
MRVVLINEFSQAAKNPIVHKMLVEATREKGIEVFNVGMENTEERPEITYIHLGLMASILLNSKAVDFVVTGCGTGQGANISLNNYPGVICGLLVDPTDAYLFNQINNGNAAAIPYAKGFGWGAELNIKFIFEKLFQEPRGEGYPPERKEPQQRNARILDEVKRVVNQDLMHILNNLDPEFIRTIFSNQKFNDLYFTYSQDAEMTTWFKEFLAR